MEVIRFSVVPLAKFSTIDVPMTATTKIPSTTPLTTLEKTVELAKSMDEITLQGTKINRLKMEVESL